MPDRPIAERMVPETTAVSPERAVSHERDVFANRTLNLRSVSAIGYDMDYTLIDYRSDEWEAEAFDEARGLLAQRGWPVEGLTFDPGEFLQGLVIDVERGNLVKATRFGYVIQAQHGRRVLDYDEVRRIYTGEFVALEEPRWVFLNTMFSISEAALFAQLVDRLAPTRPDGLAYDDVHRAVRNALDDSHAQGALKARIHAHPERFVNRDEDVISTLLDQRAAGKSLMLITNSDWSYTRDIMSWYFDDALRATSTMSQRDMSQHDMSQSDVSWRDLFDLVVVSASKPGFFAYRNPAYRVVDESTGLLEPHRGPLRAGEVYHGGSAIMVEESLGLIGDQILYVGDHLFGDVHMSKATLRWRTALILRELEDEIRAANEFAPTERRLRAMMAEKMELEQRLANLRLDELHGVGDRREVDRSVSRLRSLDDRIAPLAQAASRLGNPRWGPLLRAGNDKSLFARQVERYADIYTSRVSNLGRRTPFAYLRATRTTLPHDRIDDPSTEA